MGATDAAARVRSNTVVLGTTRQATISYWSPAAEEYYGLPAHRAIGRPAKNVLAWYAAAHDGQRFTNLRVGDVCVFQHGNDRRGQRQSRLIRTTLTVAVDSEGREEFLYSSLPVGPGEDVDVVRPDRFEPPQHPADLVSFCSRRMTLTYSPPGMQQLTGYQTRDILGHSSLEFVHPDDRGRWIDTWEGTLREPLRQHRIEARWRDSTGRWIPFMSQLENRLAEPSTASVVVRTWDSSDPPGARAAREEAEAALQGVLELSGDAIWSVNREGRTTFANQRLADLFEISLRDVDTLVLDEVIEPALAHAVLAGPGGTHTCADVTIVTGKGRPLRLRLGIVPRGDGAQRSDGAILLWRQTPVAPWLGGTESSRGRGPAALRPPARTDADAVPPRSGDQPRSLTKRERQIVELLMRGDRVPAIAAVLGVGQSTVRNHLSATFRKFSVRSQQELVEYFRDQRGYA